MKKDVVIYTFKTCPYCVHAKKLLNQEGIDFKEIDVTTQREKLDELKIKTNCSTVPQIFVNDKFIGGCDDLLSLHEQGKFDELFK